MTRRLLLMLALALPTAFLPACGEEPEEVAEPTGPVVGDLSLPLSLRLESEPRDSYRFEVSPTELRLDGELVMALDRGDVPEAERSGDVLPKLAEALSGGTARRLASLRMHVNVPWLTTTLILNTLKQANVHEAGFVIRQSPDSNVGFLRLARFEVRPQSDEPAEFPPTHQRQWNELAPIWEQMQTSCREGNSVDCDYKPTNIAEDGNMQILLFARGQALKVQLDRFGIEEEEAPAAGGGGGGLIEGVAPPPPPAGEEEQVPPATTAAFTWRFQGATGTPSPISNTLRPLCGAQPCGVILEAEEATPTMRMVTFLGAVFPTGTDAPQVVVQIPSR